MKQPNHTIAAILAVTCLSFSAAARADEESEREQLARIATEIQYLQRSVAEAAKRAPSSPRVRFQYEWLQKDLDAVRAGVEEHLNAPRQPRSIPPLRGDYRH